MEGFLNLLKRAGNVFTTTLEPSTYALLPHANIAVEDDPSVMKEMDPYAQCDPENTQYPTVVREDQFHTPSLDFISAHPRPQPDEIESQYRPGVYVLRRMKEERKLVMRSVGDSTTKVATTKSESSESSGCSTRDAPEAKEDDDKVGINMDQLESGTSPKPTSPATPDQGRVVQWRTRRYMERYVVAGKDSALARFAMAYERIEGDRYRDNVTIAQHVSASTVAADAEDVSLGYEPPEELDVDVFKFFAEHDYFEIHREVVRAFSFVEANHHATSMMLCSLMSGRSALPEWADRIVNEYVGNMDSDYFLPEQYAIYSMGQTLKLLNQFDINPKHSPHLYEMEQELVRNMTTYDRLLARRILLLKTDVPLSSAVPHAIPALGRSQHPPPPPFPSVAPTTLSATMTVSRSAKTPEYTSLTAAATTSSAT